MLKIRYRYICFHFCVISEVTCTREISTKYKSKKSKY